MTQDSGTTDTTLDYYEGNAKKFFVDTVAINMTMLYSPFRSYMPPYAAILDAGCGTGLCGPLLKPYTKKEVGVDLSANMLIRAKGTDTYDQLVLVELTEFLNSHPNAYDLIVSADTLC